MVSGIKSAKLKLARAAKHLRAIKIRVAEYSASQPHKIVKKAKGKKRLNIPTPPPREISLLAGEMIYQMRSALDHLTFDIINANPNISLASPNWRERCQFPLKTKLPKNRTPPLPKSEFEKSLPGISDEAFAIIEAMQPYYRAPLLNYHLGLLAHLSNIDKHRHLNLIRPQIRQLQFVKFRSGRLSGSFKLLERGAEIEPASPKAEPDRPVYVNRRYTSLVAFDELELGNATFVPVDKLLGFILSYVKVFAVPALRKLIEKQ